MFEAIPTELKQLRQWIVWRGEWRDGKLHKIPLQASFGDLASVTEPSNWCDFDSAVATSIKQNLGLGFVFVKGGGYTGVDFDLSDDPAIIATQNAIYAQLPGYAERSPSGGCHIIVRGTLEAGFRLPVIEVYPHERFFTMTGDVIPERAGAGIVDCQAQLYELYARKQKMQSSAAVLAQDSAAIYSDQEIYEKCSQASNGDKFLDLWSGIDGVYGSGSEADYALIDMLQFFCKNKEQLTRIFKFSARYANLIARKKNDRHVNTYLIPRMIDKSFDREVPGIDMELLKLQIQNMKLDDLGIAEPPEASPAATVAASIEESPYQLPPGGGLLHDVARFIYDAAPRPVPEIALAGAIGFLAGICGSSFNVSRTGLNQYVILVAASGVGKDAMSSGISKLCKVVTEQRMIGAIQQFIGPSEIASGQALRKTFKQSKSYVSIMSEYGYRLSELSSDRAGPAQTTLKRVLLEAYSKSGDGQMFGAMAYSDKERNENAMTGCAFSMLCESTPSTLYSVMNERMVSDGLLPRMLLIEYNGPRVALNEAAAYAAPDDHLTEHLARLVTHSLGMMQNNVVMNIGMDDAASIEARNLELFCDDAINKESRDAFRELWNRVALKTVKLAALAAVGVNHVSPCIDRAQYMWAKAIVMKDVATILAKFDQGEVGANLGAGAPAERVQHIAKVLVGYIEGGFTKGYEHVVSKSMHDQLMFSNSWLLLRMSRHKLFSSDPYQPSNVLVARSLQDLLAMECIAEVNTRDKGFIAEHGETRTKLFRVLPNAVARLRSVSRR